MARPRSYNIILILCFVITISTPLLGTLLSDNKDISEQEKRRLAPFPRIEWNWRAILTLPKALEPYYNDHFFLRSQLVAADSFLRMKLFRRSPIFVVLVGYDGWLFTISDWALHDYLGINKLAESDAQTWKRVLSQRRQWAAQWGGHYLLAVAPNKMMVYPEHLPDRIKNNGGITALDSLNDFLEDSSEMQSVLDLRSVMHREKPSHQLYFRNDTHWNSWGAYVAYREIMTRLKRWYPDLQTLDRQRLTSRTKESPDGDLALAMGLKDILSESDEILSVKQRCATAYVPVITPLIAKKSQPVKSGCAQAAPLRVLVMGDSFISSLEQYLSESFQEVLYERDLDFNQMKDFIRAYRPDLILHIHVGRFMPRAFRLDADIDKELAEAMDHSR